MRKMSLLRCYGLYKLLLDHMQTAFEYRIMGTYRFIPSGLSLLGHDMRDHAIVIRNYAITDRLSASHSCVYCTMRQRQSCYNL